MGEGINLRKVKSVPSILELFLIELECWNFRCAIGPPFCMGLFRLLEIGLPLPPQLYKSQILHMSRRNTFPLTREPIRGLHLPEAPPTLRRHWKSLRVFHGFKFSDIDLQNTILSSLISNIFSFQVCFSFQDESFKWNPLYFTLRFRFGLMPSLVVPRSAPQIFPYFDDFFVSSIYLHFRMNVLNGGPLYLTTPRFCLGLMPSLVVREAQLKFFVSSIFFFRFNMNVFKFHPIFTTHMGFLNRSPYYAKRHDPFVQVSEN